MSAPAANASIGSSTKEVSLAKAVARARRRGRTRPDASDLLAVTATTTRRGRERKTPLWLSKVSVVHVERFSRVAWKWSAEEARVRHGAGGGEGEGEGEGDGVQEIGGMKTGMDTIFVGGWSELSADIAAMLLDYSSELPLWTLLCGVEFTLTQVPPLA